MSLFRSLHVSAVACALSVGALPLVAQLADAPVLPIGRTLDGTLSRNDQSLNERGRFRIFRLDARAGQRYTVVMRADDFDSYISIARQVNGLTDYMASDDDGAGNSNARLKWTAKVAGTYYLVAQSLKPEGTGAFTVRLDTLPPVVIRPPRTIALGEAMRGELTDTDQSVDEKGGYFHLYRLQAHRGQRLIIEMQSAAVDSKVEIGHMIGDSLDVDENDDDGGGDKNARMRYTVKEDGTYFIRAQSLDANATGSYTLKVSEKVTRPSAITNMVMNTPMTGELTETDEEADDGSYFKLYRVTVRAGEKLTITMRSAALDSYIVLGHMVDGDWDQIAFDDDGGGGKNARLEHTFDTAGEYLIRANTVGANATGSFIIRADRAVPSRPTRRS